MAENTIHPVDLETGRLISGPYEGEYLGVCDSESMTTRIPNVKFTREEAAAFRDRFGLTPEKFHLDIDDNTEGMTGTYCIYYANPALINDYIERMDCSSLFGESAMEVMARKLPLVESSRCTKISNALHKIAGTPTFWEKQGEFANIALWFAMLSAGVGAVATEGGRSVLKKIFGGKGPDDKNDPPSAGGGRWGEGEVVDAEWSEVKKESKGILPAKRSAVELVAAGATLVALSLAIAWIVANDATGLGFADDWALAPAFAGWAGAAAVFSPPESEK